MTFRLIILAAILCLVWACKKDDSDKVPVGTVDCTTVTYSGTISTLISNNCNNSSCHGAGSSNGDFTNYASLKPFADNDKLNSRVIDRQDMPVGGPLTSNQLGQLQCWLDDGAPNN